MVGTAVIIALAVIFVPMILDGARATGIHRDGSGIAARAAKVQF